MIAADFQKAIIANIPGSTQRRRIYCHFAFSSTNVNMADVLKAQNRENTDEPENLSDDNAIVALRDSLIDDVQHHSSGQTISCRARLLC